MVVIYQAVIHSMFASAENHVILKQQQWRIPLKNAVDSGKTVFDISVNTGQICTGLESNSSEK